MEPLESLPVTPAADEPAEARPSAFRPNRLTSGIVAGGAAVAMVLAGLGIASAQTEDSVPAAPPAVSAESSPAPEPAPRKHGPRGHGHKPGLTGASAAIGITETELRTELKAGKSIAAVATAKGVDVQRVIDALVAEAKTRLATAVTEGRITQAQADQKTANLGEHITNHVNHVPTPGDRSAHKGRHHRGHKPGLTAASAAIGITEAELRTELKAGKSIAAVATAKGVDVQRVIDALVAEAKTRLATAVTEGRITQAQADQKTANLGEHITNHVNHVPTPGDRSGHKRRGPADGPAPATAPETAPEAAPATFSA